MNASYLGKAMDAILEGQTLPAGPAQPDLTYEVDMHWGFGNTDQSCVVRAHYFVHFASVYDQGQGRGRVTITAMEVNEGSFKNPVWKPIKLADEMIEALEKEIRDEVGVEDEDDEASEIVFDRGRAL